MENLRKTVEKLRTQLNISKSRVNQLELFIQANGLKVPANDFVNADDAGREY